MEDKYRNENTDLGKRVDAESTRNIELSTGIKDFEMKIRGKEDQIMYMKKELEGARYSNSALLYNNSNLQVEIDSLNNHIKVISKQNEDLTIELDQFVQANEAIRQRLDRKHRVEEIRARNDQQLAHSISAVHQVGPDPRGPPYGGFGGGGPPMEPPRDPRFYADHSPPRR